MMPKPRSRKEVEEARKQLGKAKRRGRRISPAIEADIVSMERVAKRDESAKAKRKLAILSRRKK